MLSWLAGKMIARNMRSMRAGDPGPTLAMDADDIRFTFPGESGHIHLDDSAEGRVYDNRYVIWGRIAWGKLREYEVYEDTEKSRRLDEYLARVGKE
jgi:hypothetical protein